MTGRRDYKKLKREKPRPERGLFTTFGVYLYKKEKKKKRGFRDAVKEVILVS